MRPEDAGEEITSKESTALKMTLKASSFQTIN